jgi:CRP/FNR family transcriptional regulator, cyclic AMP receptor protein
MISPRARLRDNRTRRPTVAVHSDVQQTLITSGIFGKTDVDVVSALTQHLLPVRFPPGHVVFAQGDPGNCLYMIASGKVKLAYRHGDGREVVFNIVGAPDVFGEVAPFDYGTREFTATAVTEVCAVAIERDQLFAWMSECPHVIHQIMRLLARHAEVMTKSLADLVFADPPYRVARRLLLLSRRFGRRYGDVVRVAHDLTLEEISLLAGVSPETVDATLRDFRDRGWIRLEDSCLEIVDGQGLATLPARQ